MSNSMKSKNRDMTELLWERKLATKLINNKIKKNVSAEALGLAHVTLFHDQNAHN